MHQKVLKTGNSLAVTIPSDFVKILGVQPGAEIQVKTDVLNGILTYTFTSSGQMTLLPKK